MNPVRNQDSGIRDKVNNVDNRNILEEANNTTEK